MDFTRKKVWPPKGTGISTLTEAVAAAVTVEPSEPTPVFSSTGHGKKKTFRQTVIDATAEASVSEHRSVPGSNNWIRRDHS